MKEENEMDNTKQTKKKGKPAALMFMAVLLVLLIAYVGLAVYFNNHFCFGTTIDGIDVGGSSVSGVEDKIRKEIGAYELRLIERDDKSETISGDAVAITPVFDGELERLLKEQNGFAWIMKLIRPDQLELENAVTYDENALDEVLSMLSCTQKENQRSPVDAYCSDYIEGVGYEPVPADYGTTIDMQAFREAVGNAINVLAEELDLDQSGCYLNPSVESDDQGLLSQIDSMNAYLEAEITYDLLEKTEVVNKDVIHTWLSFDNGKVSVDEEAVAEYVSSLAKKYNTAYRKKEFKTTAGETVTIENCVYGWKIDKEGEAAQILEDLKGKKPVTREPVYSQRANSHGDTDYGDSYVEINLSAQHLYLYKDGKMVVESDFVSGNLSKGYVTPPGMFPLTYKTLDATLRGEGYATPVKFWMPFNGNIGMHDATWRKSFGGSIFKTNGSHGCVNLPYSAAEKIYENIDKGYAVIAYIEPGKESEMEVPQESSKVSQVIALINSIGSVTQESEGVIAQARGMYDALTEEEKAQVGNYGILTSAERYLMQLKGIIPWDAPADQQQQPADQQPQQPADQQQQPADQQPQQPADQQPQPADQQPQQPADQQQQPTDQQQPG